MSRPERQKLLIVERKLVSNRGHHHTQVSALRALFPDHDVHILAGETYDGFLGAAVGRLDAKPIKLAKYRSRLQYGSLSERVDAGFGALKMAHTLKLPPSAFGAQLADICRSLGIGADDIVIVPTAELDTFESAVEMTAILGNQAPLICLRFLNSELGDRHEKIRRKRLRAAAEGLRPNIFLFSETEELALFLHENFGMPVAGGFYLPCSMSTSSVYELVGSDKFKIGVFGEPRPEKGSARIAGIVAALAGLAHGHAAKPIDLLVQGSPEDFQAGGFYDGLREFEAGKAGVFVSPQSNRISPAEFERLFQSVDAVLLPYDRSVYGVQGSGVIQDAVVAHKPIIYSEGMSMGEFLSHGNGFAATTDQEFAKAILHVAENPAACREGAARAAARFHKALADNPLLGVVGKAEARPRLRKS